MSSCTKCKNPHKTSSHYVSVWQKKNKEKVNKKTHEWSTSHREQVTEIRRKYRKTENGRNKQRNAVRNYESSHSERKKAWNKAVKLPKLPCVKCGSFLTHKHHPDISKPLEVIYLCPLHHKQIHVML